MTRMDYIGFAEGVIKENKFKIWRLRMSTKVLNASSGTCVEDATFFYMGPVFLDCS